MRSAKIWIFVRPRRKISLMPAYYIYTQQNPDQTWEEALSWKTLPWQDVDTIHHFTDMHTLNKAEPSEFIEFITEEQEGDITVQLSNKIPCARFSCNVWNDRHPPRAPWGSNHIDFVAKCLFRSDDFLFPADDTFEASPDGNIYVDMVYISRKTLLLAEGFRLNYSEWSHIQRWELSRNPLVQFKDGHLKYRSAPGLWFNIMVPHEVVIPHNAVWTYGVGDTRMEVDPVTVRHLTTSEILEALWLKLP
jgi:hypothetical protein